MSENIRHQTRKRSLIHITAPCSLRANAKANAKANGRFVRAAPFAGSAETEAGRFFCGFFRPEVLISGCEDDRAAH